MAFNLLKNHVNLPIFRHIAVWVGHKGRGRHVFPSRIIFSFPSKNRLEKNLLLRLNNTSSQTMYRHCPELSSCALFWAPPWQILWKLRLILQNRNTFLRLHIVNTHTILAKRRGIETLSAVDSGFMYCWSALLAAVWSPGHSCTWTKWTRTSWRAWRTLCGTSGGVAGVRNSS